MTMTDAAPVEQEEAPAAEAEPAKKKRSNLVPALVLAAGMLGAAFMLKPAPPIDPNATTTTAAAGPVVALDAMTLNLEDDHLIRIGVAVELAETADAEAFEGEGATNRLKDLIIFEVSGLTSEQVSSAEGLDSLKHTLTEGAEELYGEEFHGLYLTDLVVQ